MLKDIVTSQAFAVIVSGILTLIGTIYVAKLGSNRTNRRAHVKNAKDFEGYQGWVDYMQQQVKEIRKDCNEKLDEMEAQLDVANATLENERTKNARLRTKLLDISRTHGVDVSDVLY